MRERAREGRRVTNAVSGRRVRRLLWKALRTGGADDLCVSSRHGSAWEIFEVAVAKERGTGEGRGLRTEKKMKRKRRKKGKGKENEKEMKMKIGEGEM
jgi:hypothetical protein